jgi:hypothetical protein
VSSGPRGVPNSQVSRQLQYRRVSYNIPKLQEDNRSKGRVHVHAWWFEVDAYGAAVEGILMSIKHALASGSLGQGSEEYMLREVLRTLLRRDPHIKHEDWMVK